MKSVMALLVSITVVLGACGGTSDDLVQKEDNLLNYLRKSGMDVSDEFMVEKWSELCPISIYAKKGTFSSNTVEKDCVNMPLGDYKLLAVRVKVISEVKCSYSADIIRANANLEAVAESDRLFGRAIDLALKAKDIDASAKLGQMQDKRRDYLKVASNMDTGKMWAKATSGWGFGTNAWCDLRLEGYMIRDN